MSKTMALALAVAAALSAVARTVENYNDGWEFSHDRKDWKKVRVPHDWAIEEGFDPKLPHGSGALPWKGVGYYRKTLTLDKTPTGRLFLAFDGIMCDGTVFVDGQCVGHQAYGYLGLTADLTPYVHIGKNEILVRADTTKLHSRWYPGAGMFRNVRLVATDAAYLSEEELFIHTPAVTREKATVKVEGVLRNRGAVTAEGLVSGEFTFAGGEDDE